MNLKNLPSFLVAPNDHHPKRTQHQQGVQQQQSSLGPQVLGDLAVAHVTVAAGTPAFDSNRGFASLADTGAGVVTMVLKDAQNLTTAGLCLVTVDNATFAAATVSITDTTTLVVRTWDAAGAALDNISFWIHCFAISPA